MSKNGLIHGRITFFDASISTQFKISILITPFADMHVQYWISNQKLAHRMPKSIVQPKAPEFAIISLDVGDGPLLSRKGGGIPDQLE